MALDFKDFLSAYDPAKGDPYIQYRRQKYRRTDTTSEAVETESAEQLDESDTALANKAKESGVSLGTLRKVFNRGMAAWRVGHRPGTTPQQWGMARVNSYITKGKTYHTSDADLREESEVKYRKMAVHKDSGIPKRFGTGETSTDKKRVAHFKKGAEKHWDDPSAYKPAPGDATAETKPSKFTTAYKKMFKEESHLGEAGAFSYGMKKPRKGSSAWNAIQMAKKDKTSPIEPKDQKVGVAKVTRESVEVDEALNIQQRRQRMMQFKRNKSRIEIGAERAKKRVASKEVLMKRARKAARNMLLKKMAKVSSKSELDFARREQIEKRLDKMKNKINMLAVKMFPQLRRMDIERKQGKSSQDQK